MDGVHTFILIETVHIIPQLYTSNLRYVVPFQYYIHMYQNLCIYSLDVKWRTWTFFLRT